MLSFALENKVPCVICTTGYSTEQVEKIKEASKSIPVFYSGNMSLGINLLIELSKQAAKVLGSTFDIEIVEKHHNLKLDAPSGTALMIADGISETLEQEPMYVYDRHSYRKKRARLLPLLTRRSQRKCSRQALSMRRCSLQVSSPVCTIWASCCRQKYKLRCSLIEKGQII